MMQSIHICPSKYNLHNTNPVWLCAVDDHGCTVYAGVSVAVTALRVHLILRMLRSISCMEAKTSLVWAGLRMLVQYMHKICRWKNATYTPVNIGMLFMLCNLGVRLVLRQIR